MQSLALLLSLFVASDAFAPNALVLKTHSSQIRPIARTIAFENDKGIIDLTDDDEEDSPPTSTTNTPAAPFLSQGEISSDPNLLNPDFKDPKQTRVIIYIILTLVPILFLIPLMIGSRDLIPLDALPPVELN